LLIDKYNILRICGVWAGEQSQRNGNSWIGRIRIGDRSWFSEV